MVLEIRSNPLAFWNLGELPEPQPSGFVASVYPMVEERISKPKGGKSINPPLDPAKHKDFLRALLLAPRRGYHAVYKEYQLTYSQGKELRKKLIKQYEINDLKSEDSCLRREAIEKVTQVFGLKMEEKKVLEDFAPKRLESERKMAFCRELFLERGGEKRSVLSRKYKLTPSQGTVLNKKLIGQGLLPSSEDSKDWIPSEEAIQSAVFVYKLTPAEIELLKIPHPENMTSRVDRLKRRRLA